MIFFSLKTVLCLYFTFDKMANPPNSEIHKQTLLAELSITQDTGL